MYFFRVRPANQSTITVAVLYHKMLDAPDTNIETPSCWIVLEVLGETKWPTDLDTSYEERLQNCEKRLLASSCLSVRPYDCPSVRPSIRMGQLGSHWTDFHEILYLSIFRKSVEKIQVSLKSNKNKGYQYTFLIISRSVLLRMRNVSDESRRENYNTHFVSSNSFFFLENRTVYEIMSKNIVEPGWPQTTIWRKRIACWIPKATNTHTQDV